MRGVKVKVWERRTEAWVKVLVQSETCREGDDVGQMLSTVGVAWPVHDHDGDGLVNALGLHLLYICKVPFTIEATGLFVAFDDSDPEAVFCEEVLEVAHEHAHETL